MKNLFTAVLVSLYLLSYTTKAQSVINQDSINYESQFHLPWWGDDGEDYPSNTPPKKGPWGDYPTPYYNL